MRALTVSIKSEQDIEKIFEADKLSDYKYDSKALSDIQKVFNTNSEVISNYKKETNIENILKKVIKSNKKLNTNEIKSDIEFLNENNIHFLDDF